MARSSTKPTRGFAALTILSMAAVTACGTVGEIGPDETHDTTLIPHP